MIDIHDLSKTFALGSKRSTVLDAVSVHVPRGSITGVIGPSGAGKTTLLRCVNRLETPDSGTIVVDGTEVTAPMSGREVVALRRKAGMVFQQSSLMAHRTAEGNVAYPLEVHGVGGRERQARVADLLARVGLSPHARSYPSELSGGQRQRVGIARALALNPKILLADEATSGLDPDTTVSVLNLMRQLHDDLDLTILLITHEMDVVRRYCDRATLLRDGRVVDHGVVAELAADPDSELGRQLFSTPAANPPGDDEVSLALRLGEATESWLADLTVATGIHPRLTSASIEAVDCRTVGLATIVVSAEWERDCRKWLTANGIHIQEADA
ncbi:methionine ABC transporter ATP-binding protein [Mycolicibacterium porcinum]|uniref:Methionine ABC transporter ATP-binding protein n=1 Tax=Mycolicibacterium porcinum TaxID=39693 RepID=A0AAW5T6X1_9MYCO|nr:methionine ABC transporter ATP-binding protein [Mycolicibacterium porcinum]MCV7390428.1 methionine ABC transporter ATP-binding protein [Mycolicibacterium porcinum]CDO31018.1 methionine import ATP-binding protein metN [Mycolicibacterium vulneris]